MSDIAITTTARQEHDALATSSTSHTPSTRGAARRPPPVLAQCGLTPDDLQPLGPDARLAPDALLTVERGEDGAVVGHQWIRDLQPPRGSSGRWSRRGDRRGLFAVPVLAPSLTGPGGWLPRPAGEEAPLLLVNGATEAIAAAIVLRPRGRALVIAAPPGQWTEEATAGLRTLAQAQRFTRVLLGFPETVRGDALAVQGLFALDGALRIRPVVRELRPPAPPGEAPPASWSAALRRMRGQGTAP